MFCELTGVKQGDVWRAWNLEDQIADPDRPGKLLWVANFERGVGDPTNHNLLRQITSIVMQNLKVSSAFLSVYGVITYCKLA